MVGSLNLIIKYTNFTSWEHGASFSETSDCLFLTKTMTAIWEVRPDQRSPILKVNIVLNRLVAEENHTPSLFDQNGDYR